MMTEDGMNRLIVGNDIPSKNDSRLIGILLGANPFFDLNEKNPVMRKFSDRRVPTESLLKRVDPSRGYLLISQKSSINDVVGGMKKEEMKGTLIFSRTPPRRIREMLKIKDNEIEMYWLTMLGNVDDPTILPTEVPKINIKIQDFLKRRKGRSYIFLEGIEFLVIHNGFEPVMKFLQYTNDIVTVANSNLFVFVDPLAFDMREWRMMARELEPIILED